MMGLKLVFHFHTCLNSPYELNCRSIPIKTSFDKSFPLVNRRDIFQILSKYCKEYFLSLEQSLKEREQIDKTRIAIPYIAVAPGSGKSKLMTHHIRGLVDQVFTFVCSTHSIAVTLGNGSSRIDCKKRI